MIKGFMIRGLYRHSNPNITCDIEVLKIRHVDERRTKMRVCYRHRMNGRKQYTAKGNDWHSDEVRVMAKDYIYWTRIYESGNTEPSPEEMESERLRILSLKEQLGIPA